MFEKWGGNEDSSCSNKENGKWKILGIYILKGVTFVAKHILKKIEMCMSWDLCISIL
jgi:hypothetical protein